MALFYRTQGHIERLAAKNGAGATSNYLSDQKVALFGGRGNTNDFIKYVGTETRKSDAWVRFASANGASAGNRADQLEHEFTINGSYP